MDSKRIVCKKVSVHNLKQVDVSLPVGAFIVFTGLSGSGKSSLAFDTIFAEGQRQYMASLPAQAKRQLEIFSKPECESIEGLSPTIAIEQKTVSKNPRSTVGTLTGIYDYLRVLFARLGQAHCPLTDEPLKGCSKEEIAKSGFLFAKGYRTIVLAPLVKGKKGEFKDLFSDLERSGYRRARIDGTIYDLSDKISLDPSALHTIDLVMDRLEVNEEDEKRFIEAIFAALEKGEGLVKLLLIDENREKLFSTGFYAQGSDTSYPELKIQDFSFNHPEGMCPACQGLGEVFDYDLSKIINPQKSLKEDCISVAPSYNTLKWGNIYRNLASLYNFSLDTPWENLPTKAQNIILYGLGEKWLKIHVTHPEKKGTWTEYVQWAGVLQEARRRFDEAQSTFYKDKMRENMVQGICKVCNGSRLRPYPAATRLFGKKIDELTALDIEALLSFFSSISLSADQAQIAQEMIKEIIFCLTYLVDVGIGYVCLNRTSPTLSGGEAQRVRLAAQLGCGLSGITYVLDEPSIGLHAIDNAKLIQTLKNLRDQGNTVIVVEHDEETLLAADYIVEMGPGAGSEGGKVVFAGTPQELVYDTKSLSSAYLQQLQKPPEFKKPRRPEHYITVTGASLHNVKNLSLKIPLKMVVGIVGVSGSGKSSVICDILYPLLSNICNKSALKCYPVSRLEGVEKIDKVIEITQAPIGRSPRSNPATYIKLWDDIRELYGMLPESQVSGLTSSHFSFNAKSGSCLSCSGMGMIKIDMDFMEEAYLDCPHCLGKRFDQKTLSISYKNKTIYDVLKMSVSEALKFFSAIPKIAKKLQVLEEVGLSYLTLGQSATTLSGGEAQRIKLAKELVRPSSGQTLYIFDEPTTGLHLHDIQRLLGVLEKLVEGGNSCWIIEHNLEMMKACDYLIEMGPGAGSKGGEVIATGTPASFLKKSTPTALSLQAKKELVARAPQIQQGERAISVVGASTHNLKKVHAHIPYGKITVCSGPSGSGKSSFAFDTVYAEGQRRYSESLPHWAQQFIKLLPKPHFERITGLLASVAIEQRAHVGNPRSTVGTMTEIYDLLRVLYAQAGHARCPETLAPIEEITVEFVLDELYKSEKEGAKLIVLAPLSIKNKEDFDQQIKQLAKWGYLRVYLNDVCYELDEVIDYNPKLKNQLQVVIDRIKLSPENRERLYEALKNAQELGKSELYVRVDETCRYFNLKFAAIDSGRSYPTLTASSFSFNAEEGMCPVCSGLGLQYAQLKLETLLEEPGVWLDIFDQLLIGGLPVGYEKPLERLFNKQGGSLYVPYEESALFILEGGKADVVKEEKRWRLKYRGIQKAASFAALHAKAPYKGRIAPYFSEKTCTACQGERLNPLSRLVHIEGMTLGALTQAPLTQALGFIQALKLPNALQELLSETLGQISSRLICAIDIGLGYLSLSRMASTLSGGEAQRVRLSQVLGSGLTGCLYVLDEPTIGLHPHNNHLLNQALLKIKEKGNTLLLVEHDPMTLQLADQLLDFGPQAGLKGGQIMASGSLEQIKHNADSLTGAYLSGRKQILPPKEVRKVKEWLYCEKVAIHNLKQIDVALPLGILCGITGVSGSGKSSLIKSFCHEAITLGLKTGVDNIQTPLGNLKGIAKIQRLITLSQEPLGTTSRADIATYVDLMTPLRQFFAQLPGAKTYGLQGKHFSFNHRAGMCQKCSGHGYKKVQLQYMPDVRIKCDTCQGYRFNPLSLSVTYQGKHLGQILELSVAEAAHFLPKVPKITKRIELLLEVGLGYLPLNQEIAKISGGEGQRLRLAKELAKRSHKESLYLLDEPTVGLHASDIALLIPIFQRMIHQGASFIIIEHNIDLLRCCDYLIELGPGAGDEGGQLVVQGTPKELMSSDKSITGPYLKGLV